MALSRFLLRGISPLRKATCRLVIGRHQGTAATATFQLPDEYMYQLHKLEDGPSHIFSVEKDEALNFYKDMVTIRRIETEAKTLYQKQLIRGFCHLCAGQEAISVGMKAAMGPDDSVITAYRAHGWTYSMGVTPREILSELTGKKSGCSSGKGGSMHMYGKNFYGGNGIVGAQAPLGAGIALAQEYQDTNNVCITLYGDGAANQGQLFETFNMAKLWDLPCIFVCENNYYGMGTSVKRASASTRFYTRGDYIPGIWVDGMNVLAVREATKYALEYVRSGRGPMVMEMDTYRYYGHSMSDPGNSYRDPEEVTEMRKTRDPIMTFGVRLMHAGLVTNEDLKAIQSSIKKQVKEDAEHAEQDPVLPVSELYTHVYKDLPQDFKIRGCDPFTVVKATA